MMFLAFLCLYCLCGEAESQTAVAKVVLQSWNVASPRRYGSIRLEEVGGSGMVRVTGSLSGLTPGLHGFHIHALGDLEGGCTSATGHFNPMSRQHGAPTASNRHVGDLGNIQADAQGNARVDITDRGFSLFGPNSVLGRAFVLHSGRDDLGLGGNAESLKTGNAGSRLACGVIGIASSNFVQSAGTTGVLPSLVAQPLTQPLNSNGVLPYTSPQAQQGGCVDAETKSGRTPETGQTMRYCDYWRSKGWCNHPNYAANMALSCAKTCGRC